MSKFQLVVLGIFAFAIVTGLVLFASLKGTKSQDSYSVHVWGTIDASLISNYVDKAVQQNKSKITVVYQQMRPDVLYKNYVESLINGNGPDALLLPHDMMWQFRSKVVPIPYANYPLRDYTSAFIQEGELYTDASGLLAIPFAVDPMVMYWNRDLFTNALIPNPPQYWEEFLAMVPTLTKKDAATNITQSAAALGEYKNIAHAKEIVSLLMLQVGNPITVRGDGGLFSVLADDTTRSLSPSKSALSFYTQFADPIKQVYTWNRALPDSKTLFISNKLALYFGYASELKDITTKNPNLNFGVTLVPQRKPQQNTQVVNTTFGQMYGFSIARSTKNYAATFAAITYLTNPSTLPLWVNLSSTPSVRRDALAVDSSKTASTIFATSALIARGWLDPDPLKTQIVFKDMIENITSGRMNHDDSLTEAAAQIGNIIRLAQ